MKKIILHIGPHKTGSTFIQKTLFNCKQELLKRNLLYPDAFSRLYGHHYLSAFLKSKNTTEVEKNLNKLIEYSGSVILSCENLSKLSLDDLLYFKGLLNNIETEIIYCYRTPSQRLYSSWQESIKHGGVRGYFEYVHSHYLKPYASDELFPGYVLEKFSKVFGKQSIKIIHYDAKDLDLFGEFQNILNINISYNNSDVVNKSLSYAETEILRALNCLALQKGQLDKHNIRDMYAKRNYNALNQLILTIRNGIEADSKVIALGATNLDKAFSKYMTENWRKNIVNLTENVLSCNEMYRQVPLGNWLFDKKLFENIQQLYEKIYIKEEEKA